MVENHVKSDYYALFQLLPVGQVMTIPVSCLTPTQKDDGARIPNTELMWDPIEACDDQGKVLIVHGHHRFFTLLNRNPKFEAEVIKVRNPYLDY